MRNGIVVTFALDEALFAIPVARVQEILEARPLAPLPRAPRHLAGLLDVRGRSVAVVDFRHLLGAEPRPDSSDTRIVVLWLGQREEGHQVALRVDRVIEVTELDPGGAEPLAERERLRWDERIVDGIGRRNGTFVTVLKLDGVLDPHVVAAATPLEAISE